jgi:hypothetical protein
MYQLVKHFYEFGDFQIDVKNHLLLRAGEGVALNPKTFDLLLALILKQGDVATKDELLKTVWKETVVEEANLLIMCIFSEGFWRKTTTASNTSKRSLSAVTVLWRLFGRWGMAPVTAILSYPKPDRLKNSRYETRKFNLKNRVLGLFR